MTKDKNQIIKDQESIGNIQITQKQRLEEARKIAWRFQMWMGFQVCDSEEDMLSLRKLVKKIKREAIKEAERQGLWK